MQRPRPVSTLLPYTTLFRSGSGSFRSSDADPTPSRSKLETTSDWQTGVALSPGGHTSTALGGGCMPAGGQGDRKSTRLNSSHRTVSYAGFRLKKKNHTALTQ